MNDAAMDICTYIKGCLPFDHCDSLERDIIVSMNRSPEGFCYSFGESKTKGNLKFFFFFLENKTTEED